MKTEQTGHTPGPWKHVEPYIDPGHGRNIVQDNGDRQGLYLGSVDYYIPAGPANARLVASAPELLEAVKNLLCYVEADADDEQERLDYKQAKAALDKATGGQP